MLRPANTGGPRRSGRHGRRHDRCRYADHRPFCPRIPGASAPVGGRGQNGGMTVTGRLELVAFDAPDIERLASFYVELTGWQIVRKVPDWIALQAADGQEIAFQLAPDHVPPQWPGQEHPQQFHLDLTIDDTAAAAERAVS